ncbi:MAG: PEP-CTERM sorting domain-containing protein, partial [Propionivibrio sp.]
MKFKNLLSAVVATLVLLCHPVGATPVVIDTMPAVGDPTTTETVMGLSVGWHELATGFNVPTLGRVTHITAALTNPNSPMSDSPIFIGLASDELIGNPPPSGQPSTIPASSLWEIPVCSSTPHFNEYTGCHDSSGNLQPGTLAMSRGEYFDVDVDIFLPSSGTYWLYTRFVSDETFFDWVKNESIDTNLVARRGGMCSSDSNEPACTTFLQVGVAEAAPGIRVVYDPGLRVPEPATIVLIGIALGALAASRRKRLA